MNAFRPTSLGPLVLVVIALSACNQLNYTADGVAVVPFDAAGGSSRMELQGAHLDVHVESWLNYMPVPAVEMAKPPLHVALRISVDSPGDSGASARFEALTLWHETGDSVVATFPLVSTTGGTPEVPLWQTGTIELTNDRNRPRTGVGAAGVTCAVRLMISQGEKRSFISLPPVQIEAVY